RNVRRIDADRELVHHLIEDASGANAFGRAGEDERDAHRHLLAGDQLLKVDMQNRPLHWMPLDLSDQRARRAAVDGQLDDSARGGDAVEQLLELARVDGERLRLAAVTVDDRGDLPALPQLARDAGSPIAPRLGVEIWVAISELPKF